MEDAKTETQTKKKEEKEMSNVGGKLAEEQVSENVAVSKKVTQF